MKKLSLYLLLGIIILGCTPKVQQRFMQVADITQLPAEMENTSAMRIGGTCQSYAGYFPDTNYLDHIPIKYIRVNVHWFNSADSSKNKVGQTAIDFAKGLIDTANKDLERNQAMWLPHGNSTPLLPIRHRYVLTPRPNDPNDDGIYFHFVEDESCYLVHKGKNTNLYKRGIIRKYGVQLDTVLNIFIMPHHPDSVASPTYRPSSTGVALGPAVKIAGMAENDRPSWEFRSLLNHEIGHIYGLTHTWAYNDGCNDTPKHSQSCWSRNQRPECKDQTSNNVMDYNAEQNAWTPCQIAKVQKRMADTKTKARGFLQERWCSLNPNAHISIRDSISWKGAKDLEGHLTIERGGSLTVECRLSLPKDGRINVKAGGRLILKDAQLHNSCGEEWEGIQIEEVGKEKGEVFFVGNPNIENARNKIDLSSSDTISGE